MRCTSNLLVLNKKQAYLRSRLLGKALLEPSTEFDNWLLNVLRENQDLALVLLVRETLNAVS